MDQLWGNYWDIDIKYHGVGSYCCVAYRIFIITVIAQNE